MNVLGVNCFAHDTSAALVSDGKLVAYVEEERLNRKKHATDFPRLAIQWCLDRAGLSPRELDAVAFAYRPFLDYARALRHDILPRFPLSWKRMAVQTYVDLRLHAKAKEFRRLFGYSGPIHFVEHHLAHAAAAFLSSPFETALVLTIDRGGDYVSTAAYLCQGTRFRLLARVMNPHSLGELYSAVTWWLGFTPNWDEAKVMALAAFGRPTYEREFLSMVRPLKDGRFRVDLSWAGWHLERGWVSRRFLRRFGPPRRPRDPITHHHEDVAWGVQRVTEEAALHFARKMARRAPRVEGLCISGGVALNSVMNTRLILEGPFEKAFIPPPAGDAGNAIGAALLTWSRLTGKPRVFEMSHAYWGPDYTDHELRRTLEERKVPYRKVDDPSETAADLIAAGKIIGWFQGRAEAGPRALGNRSILADPRPPGMKDTINREVKHREPFRPFAPTILAEEAPKWFHPYTPSPFMLRVLPVRPELREKVPAVLHVDGSARLQTLEEHQNPLYYRLIKAFERRTGIPMVLNTSFNDKGEPMVCSPADALRTFYGTGLDALIMGNYLVEKGR